MDKNVTDSQLALWLLSRRLSSKLGRPATDEETKRQQERLQGRPVPTWLRDEVAVLQKQAAAGTFLEVALFQEGASQFARPPAAAHDRRQRP